MTNSRETFFVGNQWMNPARDKRHSDQRIDRGDYWYGSRRFGGRYRRCAGGGAQSVRGEEEAILIANGVKAGGMGSEFGPEAIGACRRSKSIYFIG